jgi:hypothetical protein
MHNFAFYDSDLIIQFQSRIQNFESSNMKHVGIQRWKKEGREKGRNCYKDDK